MTPTEFQTFVADRPMAEAGSVARPLVMGILNVTPDSFSDGGRFDHADVAVSQAEQLLADGADLLDIGGESTRPGSDPVATTEQIRRTVPVIRAIRQRHEVAISIDTTRSEVAEAALDAGACCVNDVAAGRADPAVLRLAADRDVPIILMHMLGRPKSMQVDPTYADVTAEVIAFLRQRMEVARTCGVRKERLVLDPGIGFGKTGAHNLRLLHDLDQIADLGRPVLVGASRKRFLGEITGESDPARRDTATQAVSAWSVMHGGAILRVHDARAARQTIDVISAIDGAIDR